MTFGFTTVALLIGLVTLPVRTARVPQSAQPPSNSIPNGAMPKEPAAILSVAAKLNGLRGSSLKPWHIRATYQTFDDKGHPQDSGTYEEYWVSDREYKRSYKNSKFTQADFGTENGLYRSGDQNWPGYTEMMARIELARPIPLNLDLRGLRLKKRVRTLDNVKL
jgi:hypothetical protein